MAPHDGPTLRRARACGVVLSGTSSYHAACALCVNNCKNQPQGSSRFGKLKCSIASASAAESKSGETVHHPFRRAEQALFPAKAARLNRVHLINEELTAAIAFVIFASA